MKMFLLYVNGIAGLEDWLDRELVFPINTLKESEKSLSFIVDKEVENHSFSKLQPGKTYAVEIEMAGRKELKYYYLKSFEIAKINNNFECKLNVSSVSVEVLV